MFYIFHKLFTSVWFGLIDYNYITNRFFSISNIHKQIWLNGIDQKQTFGWTHYHFSLLYQHTGTAQSFFVFCNSFCLFFIKHENASFFSVSLSSKLLFIRFFFVEFDFCVPLKIIRYIFGLAAVVLCTHNQIWLTSVN